MPVMCHQLAIGRTICSVPAVIQRLRLHVGGCELEVVFDVCFNQARNMFVKLQFF